MQSTSSKNLPHEMWGLVPYQTAFERQKKYVDEISAGLRSPVLVFCQHPPVVTLGRGTQPADLFAWQGQTVAVNRGGRATYHGPNQLVFYPLVDVSGSTPLKIKSKDLHAFMRVLEDSLIAVLRDFGVAGEGHSKQMQIGESEAAEATGVWVGGKKIASIGIAVKKWITYHGMAINLYHDPQAFQGINPCGFLSQQMTNLEQLTGLRVDLGTFSQSLKSQFLNRL